MLSPLIDRQTLSIHRQTQKFFKILFFPIALPLPFAICHLPFTLSLAIGYRLLAIPLSYPHFLEPFPQSVPCLPSFPCLALSPFSKERAPPFFALAFAFSPSFYSHPTPAGGRYPKHPANRSANRT